MTVILAVALVVAVAVILVLLWRNPRRPYYADRDAALNLFDRPPPAVRRRCDVCGEPATCRVVAEFDDVDEQTFSGGGTAMVADYCPDHVDGA